MSWRHQPRLPVRATLVVQIIRLVPGSEGGSREGFRMPAGRERSTQYKGAGVGKPPKNERAGKR